jgi:hypothetical protein
VEVTNMDTDTNIPQPQVLHVLCLKIVPLGSNMNVNISITALDKSSGRTNVIEWAKWDVLGDR